MEARKWTDEELKEIEERLHKEYTQAQKEIEAEWKEYMKKSSAKVSSFEKKYEEAKKSGDKDAEKKAKEVLEKAKFEQTLQNTRFQKMVEHTTMNLANVNKAALAYVQGKCPEIYSVNYNAVGDMAQDAGINFSLVNEDAVKNLVRDGDIVLPQMEKRFDYPKDQRWNTKQINSAVLQGILQGDSMDNIAARILPIVHNNEVSAMRTARTLVTGVENKGKLDSYKTLEKEGAVQKKVWIATADSRTRDWHLDMDGQEVDLGDNFVDGLGNQLEYPGDPNGAPETVYNCRCAMVTRIVAIISPITGERTEIEEDSGSGLHEKQIEQEKDKRKDDQKEIESLKASVKDLILSRNIFDGNIDDETLQEIAKCVDNISNKKLLNVVNKLMSDTSVRISEYEGTSHYTPSIKEIVLHENGKSKEEMSRVFWHEFGHRIDHSSEYGYDVTYNSRLGERTIRVDGLESLITRGENDGAFGKAAQDDVNAFLERYGLAEKYYVDSERGLWLRYRENGEGIDPTDYANANPNDVLELSRSLRRWANDITGYTEAAEYKYTQGYPRDVNRRDYFESYITPKRGIYREREKFKGASDAYYEALEKRNEDIEFWEKTHDYQAIFEKSAQMLREAEEKMNFISGATDTFDGMTHGAFGAVITLGGHNSDYYGTNNGNVKEAIANCISADVTQNEMMVKAMEDLCPNTYKLILETIKE